MKDSSAGAIGVAAIAFSILIKYLSLGALADGGVFYVILMPVVSKWSMPVAMLYGRPARQDGLGKAFIDGIRRGDVLWATVVTAVIFFATGVLFDHPAAMLAVSVSAVYVLVRLLVGLYAGQFGGLTGDTLGATAEMAETVFLIAGVIWSRHYIS
jgi:adenosylcobinamide-GDP ribazoletransferase